MDSVVEQFESENSMKMTRSAVRKFRSCTLYKRLSKANQMAVDGKKMPEMTFVHIKYKIKSFN